MNCDFIRTQLDDYLDESLGDQAGTAVAAHLAHCESCRAELALRRELLEGLRELPVPPMSPGFRERAFEHARGVRRSAFSYAAGFSGAVAAGLVIWIAMMFWQPGFDQPEGDVLQAVQLQVETPSQVSLVFNSDEDIRNVDFRLELPEGVRLAGYPGQQQLAWQDRLQKGRNVLKLNLVAERGMDGELVSTIVHREQRKVFRIPLKASETGAVLTPARQHDALII